ncbi:hypothetical protein JCM21714_1744 [Gracilibacillus boraciitolerans JCM 21714]|uniref:Integrase n=1 Tax=Gracilibacillus boraciitolerans JCM 21714 TaxID=1298598 RepID=W4VHP6_9BACI|nr:hypothetical protein [Gracilibacillus boraciitolerans]GAE92732.1 hypothetical protein JCM21714_1744 [Gracilibacillus boraciitolerans JCM 21714]
MLLKKIILRDLFNQRKRKRNKTVYQTYQYIKRFVLYLQNEKYMFDLRYITPEIIKEYVEKIKRNDITKNYLFSVLKKVERFLHEVHIAGYDIDLSEYQKILSVSYAERKAEAEANKIPNIPKRIFNQVIRCALSDIEDESLRLQDRMIACLIVILSHTGMRKGELQRLEADKLRDITILNKKEKAYILEFFTYKTTSTKDGRWTKSIAFPETVIAYQKLEELSQERRKIGNTTFLFLNKFGKRYSKSSFDYLFDGFFYRHQNELFSSLSDYEKAQVHETKVGSFLMTSIGLNTPKTPIKGETIITLNPHQFRVAVANILKNKVNLQWIREHMNHLDEEMTKHYFR